MPGQFESEERQTGGAERLAEAQAENARLRGANEQLRATVERQQAEMAGLQQRLEELERRVGLNSGNSGKPPSSDGPAKPPAPKRTRSQRGRSGKRPGGQPGHKGATLRQTDSPHRIETHRPPSCGECAAPLSAADTQGEPVRRQVFDLPQPQPLEGTEHQAYACRCRSCGSLTRAAFPEGVNAPTQYGPRIAAIAVYLQNGHFLPEERLAEIFRDLFGVVVCAATLAGMTRQAAESWRSFSERVREWIVSAAGAKHLDETGFRIGGKTQWLHVISTPWLTFYRTSARRGSLLEGLRGPCCARASPSRPVPSPPSAIASWQCWTLHWQRAPALRAAMPQSYPLHIDATCDKGKGGTFLCLAGWTGWVLNAVRVGSENEQQLRPAVERTLTGFGDPLAVLRDLGGAGAKAVADCRLRGIPDLLCHFHFLQAVGHQLLAGN